MGYIINFLIRLLLPTRLVKTHPEYTKVLFESGNLRATIDVLKNLVEKQKGWLADAADRSRGLENKSQCLENKLKKLEKERQRSLQNIIDSFPNIPCVLMNLDKEVVYSNQAAKEYLKDKPFSEEDSSWNCTQVYGGWVYTNDKRFAEKIKKVYRGFVECITPKQTVQHNAKTEKIII